ncbi:hypothetical protein RSAG8_08679, partial [Rhizoctonia solani AG-8 WAC10335]
MPPVPRPRPRPQARISFCHQRFRAITVE